MFPDRRAVPQVCAVVLRAADDDVDVRQRRRGDGLEAGDLEPLVAAGPGHSAVGREGEAAVGRIVHETGTGSVGEDDGLVIGVKVARPHLGPGRAAVHRLVETQGPVPERGRVGRIDRHHVGVTAVAARREALERPRGSTITGLVEVR